MDLHSTEGHRNKIPPRVPMASSAGTFINRSSNTSDDSRRRCRCPQQQSLTSSTTSTMMGIENYSNNVGGGGRTTMNYATRVAVDNDDDYELCKVTETEDDDALYPLGLRRVSVDSPTRTVSAITATTTTAQVGGSSSSSSSSSSSIGNGGFTSIVVVGGGGVSAATGGTTATLGSTTTTTSNEAPSGIHRDGHNMMGSKTALLETCERVRECILAAQDKEGIKLVKILAYSLDHPDDIDAFLTEVEGHTSEMMGHIVTARQQLLQYRKTAPTTATGSPQPSSANVAPTAAMASPPPPPLGRVNANKRQVLRVENNVTSTSCKTPVQRSSFHSCASPCRGPQMYSDLSNVANAPYRGSVTPATRRKTLMTTTPRRQNPPMTTRRATFRSRSVSKAKRDLSISWKTQIEVLHSKTIAKHLSDTSPDQAMIDEKKSHSCGCTETTTRRTKRRCRCCSSFGLRHLQENFDLSTVDQGRHDASN